MFGQSVHGGPAGGSCGGIGAGGGVGGVGGAGGAGGAPGFVYVFHAFDAEQSRDRGTQLVRRKHDAGVVGFPSCRTMQKQLFVASQNPLHCWLY